MVIVLAIALLALTAFNVMAAPQEEDPVACAEGNVSGMVVAVDSVNNTVTILTGDGVYCTMTLNGSYDHPIVSLLGMYFGDVNAESLQAALDEANSEVLETCAVLVDGVWQWQEEGECLGETVTVLSTDAEGNVVAVTGEGEVIKFMTDSEFAGQIAAELAEVFVEWTVDGTGDLVQVSDQIAAYHADGMGFGVLVKLYALAGDSDAVTVEELVVTFQSGTGMGQIFKEYGKPSKLGVGHVRHDKDKNGNGPPQVDPDDGDLLDQKNNGKKVKPNKQNKGLCKPKSNNGKGKGRPACSN
jgi:hypothetical protein